MRTVYIVDGARTPFLKAQGQPNPLTATDLALACARDLCLRQPFEIDAIEEVIAGCVGPKACEANIARIIALRLGCLHSTPAWTVQRNCASGLQALDCAVKDLQTGRHDLILAGGTEAMSHAPLLYPDQMTGWLANLMRARGIKDKILKALKFRPHFLKPISSLLQALNDPTIGMNMGQTAEKLAHQFEITREDMDAYAVESHRRTVAAYEADYFSEVISLYDHLEHHTDRDNGVRADSSVEKLAKLKPVFEKPFGKVTAGNSSQVSDGAAFLLLASADAVKKYQLPILGSISDTVWAGLDPSVMGLGPVYAISKLLKAHELCIEDIDYWEINEAFAAQVLACLKAMADDTFCQTQLDRKHAMGCLDPARLNIDGGAIAMGHPVGASGARLVLHLLTVLKRKKAQKGIASLCIGGGQGGAVLLKSATEVESNVS